jgi:hypothetical protein
LGTPNRIILQAAAAAVLLVPLAAAGDAGAAGADDLKDKYEEKLTHDFVKHGGWITDYDAARAKAKEEGKVLFAYFSRSYAP